MNLLKTADAVISFLIRHVLMLQVTDLVLLVYLRACLDVNWNKWSLIFKNVKQKIHLLSLVR